MPTVYIGIGSNLGSRKENCLNALSLLSDRGIRVRKQSAMIETEPWGVKRQPRFLNMAVETETELEPGGLLVLLKQIEKDMGRGETYKWGPRIIDLDILLYDGLVLNTPELQIPHPLLHQRNFVLRPLSEIAPDTIHPVLKKSIRELLEDLKFQNPNSE